MDGASSFPANTGNGVTHTISHRRPRNTTTWDVANTLNVLQGSATACPLGGSYAGVLNRLNGYTVVPNVVLGFDNTLDPAAPMFNSTNFPSATATQLTEARNIYALLTGRVTSVAGTARLNAAGDEYVYNGDLARLSRQDSFSPVRPGRVARDTDTDGERRPAVGPAPALLAG